LFLPEMVSLEGNRTSMSPFISRIERSPRALLRWAGLYLLSITLATLGVWFSAGIFGDMVVPIFGREDVNRMQSMPYYPLEIAFALLLGYLSRTQLKGSYAYYVWVPTMLYLIWGIVSYFQLGLGTSEVASRFFGANCWPHCEDQYVWTVPFYTSTLYSVGALAHRLRAARASGAQ
jgi:hypothetical protein